MNEIPERLKKKKKKKKQLIEGCKGKGKKGRPAWFGTVEI